MKLNNLTPAAGSKGREKRIAAEEELHKIENELTEKLLQVNEAAKVVR